MKKILVTVGKEKTNNVYRLDNNRPIRKEDSLLESTTINGRYKRGSQMKKTLLILGIILLVLTLTGCKAFLFNLSNWTAPDDLEFQVVMASLDTPQKIETYMKSYFTYKVNLFGTPDPYEFWLKGYGDCNDYETFERYAGYLHNWETYRMIVQFQGTLLSHTMAIFVDYGKYNYFNVAGYKEIYVNEFGEVFEHFKEHNKDYVAKSYKVYDWNDDLVEKGG